MQTDVYFSNFPAKIDQDRICWVPDIARDLCERYQFVRQLVFHWESYNRLKIIVAYLLHEIIFTLRSRHTDFNVLGCFPCNER